MGKRRGRERQGVSETQEGEPVSHLGGFFLLLSASIFLYAMFEAFTKIRWGVDIHIHVLVYRSISKVSNASGIQE